MIKFDPFAFEAAFTKYGNPVYVKNLPWINGWAETRIVLAYGGLNDPIGKEGLAHLIEHMLFQGTSSFPNKEKIRLAEKRIFFDNLGAETSFNWIVFKSRFVHSSAKKGFDFFRDLIFFPLLKEHDLAEEKRVVLSEMWRAYKLSANIETTKIFREDFFGNHPMGRSADPLYGNEETIENISPDDVATSHAKYFDLGRIFFLFVGDVRMRDAILLAERFSVDVPRKAYEIQRWRPSSWPAPSILRREISSQKFMRSTSPVRNSIQISARRMLPKNANPFLNALISNIYGSLLNEKFRHEMKATYTVNVSLEKRMDHDYLDISLESDPHDSVKMQALLQESITKFGSSKKDALFFKKTHAMLLKRSALYEYSAEDIIKSSMKDIFFDGKIFTLEEFLQLKRGITFQEVAEYVARELSSDKLYWWILTP